MPTTRKTITPDKTTLYLSDLAELFDIKPNTIRQYIRRGTIPNPTVRRDPELGWDAATIYTWAHDRGLIPLDAIPFRHLRHVIDHGEVRGAPVPRIHSAGATTQPGDGEGVQVHYGGLTDAGLRFTLYYPHEYGRLLPDRQGPGIVVHVTGHYSLKGFYVDVHQTHPDYTYAVDNNVYTQDVAQLVQEPIPYWPRPLRAAFGGVDRRTGHIVVAEDATAIPSSYGFGRSMAVESFTTDPRHADQHSLAASLRAFVAADYRRAAHDAQHDIDEYVAEHQASSWTLQDPSKHLFLAATPASRPEETIEEEFAHAVLKQLFWEAPVGDSPTARQIGTYFGDVAESNNFPLDDETPAQQAFRAALAPVPADEASLTHLAFSHPMLGRSPEGQAVSRTYWRDHYSGAHAVIFEETTDSDAYCCYEVPETYSTPIEPAEFDFDDQHQPFVWASNGAALPFPDDPTSGYALGYSGSGPQAIKAMAARLLGIDPATDVTPGWPFYRDGYPTRISAAEMRGLYAETS